ncbi:SGNH/GDSL hydrolase family protein [Nocardia xishanensis]
MEANLRADLAVVVMLGMNDLAFGVSPNDVIAAYRAIIDKATAKV